MADFSDEKMNEALTSYFKNNFKLSDGDIGVVINCFRPIELQTNEYIIKEGIKSNRFAFIVEGVARSYFIDEQGIERVTYFFCENQFMGNLRSFINNSASMVNIQAITKCRLLIIEKEDFEYLSNKLPLWSTVFDEIIKRTLLQKNTELNNLRNQSTVKDKYAHFLGAYPKIASRIPLQYIASYLGITPQSLSRIRRSTI